MLDNKLNSLLVLNETKSYSKTAELLFLTQPAVTSHIKLLEEEYGIKIFRRSGKDFILTPEGEILVSNAKKIQSLYKGIAQEIKNYKTSIKKMKIGITSGIDSSFISTILTKLSLSYENTNKKMSITLFSNRIQTLVKMLKSYEVDLIITDDKCNDSDVKTTILDSDNLVFITAKNNENKYSSSIQLEDLKNEKLVVRLPNSSTSSLFDAALCAKNMSIFDFNVIIELNSVSAIKNLVKNNLCNAILTYNSCINEINRGEIVAIPIANVTTIHDTKLLFLNEFQHLDILDEIKCLYMQEKGI